MPATPSRQRSEAPDVAISDSGTVLVASETGAPLEFEPYAAEDFAEALNEAAARARSVGDVLVETAQIVSPPT